MASLNMSLEGQSINKSYQSVVGAQLPSGPAASSPTYGLWAVFAVSAPLANAFQPDSGKESVLKVQSTGEGELVDLIDEFSDGRIQFAFVKVKDPNTTLPKCVLIAWCGAGVPERTKGYFTSHLAAVSKLLHGYHVQVTARSDSDLSPESIVRKVADASGSKYSGDNAPVSSSGPPPPVASKPVFTPTQIGGSRGFNPLASRQAPSTGRTDEDGWGEDAPPVTRTQLEKVAPAYKPTKVNMNDLTSQRQEPSRFTPSQDTSSRDDVVRGGYQPIGKVDIAALRRQAQESGTLKDDRPTIVKGSYEPVGKVDIAAIRARAQPSNEAPPPAMSERTGDLDDEPKSLAERSAAFSTSERMTTLPKPKIANKFGGGSNFTGTKAPTPGGFESKVNPSAAPVGVAGKNFADEGGKTPAQIWAEKKAREGGSTSGYVKPTTTAPIATQSSGGWDGGYTGKKWAPVSTTRTGQSGGVGEDRTGDEAQQDEDAEPTASVSAIKDRFKDSAPIASGSYDDSAPPMNLATKPSARGVPMPGLPHRPEDDRPDEEEVHIPDPPAQPPRTPTPPTPDSPIRVAQPIARGQEVEVEAPEERFSPPPLPAQSIAQAIPPARELEDETQVAGEDPARGASQAAAATTFGTTAAATADAGRGSGGQRALVQYDYEKAEDNELALIEGEYVTNIDMVDEDWWMGENSKGEKGLFPANYVEMVEDQSAATAAPVLQSVPAPATATKKPTATAQYDYEAAEDNELSFPDGATITDIEFPDDDWWLGAYNGKQGLFPANYVQLDQ